MAIVEILEVRFQADMSRLGAQLKALSGQIGTLSSALDGGRFSLANGAGNMISAVADALRSGAAESSAPQEAGSALASRFARAIGTGAASSSAAAWLNVQAADFKDEAALSAAVSAGAQLGAGFASGIASKYGAVMSAASRIANAAVSRIRSALKIHSPSKVSFELGGYFGQGFAQGVHASIRSAQDSVGALSSAGISVLSAANVPAPAANGEGIHTAVQQAVHDALGGVNLVIPLHVDGMKLGEASIRGINRVTRSAGRLMLEI